MLEDEIVAETRRVREDYAAKFDYDLEAIYRDLQAQEAQSGRPLVTLCPKEPAQWPQVKAS
ncbi:MAG: hypothetical protein ACRD9R_06890 [Pyrinomonadaceae bacterium]